MTERRALNRTQIILLCQRQTATPILCACGCGEPLEPVKEGVIDEHDLPRKLSAVGHEAERDSLENRAIAARRAVERVIGEDVAVWNDDGARTQAEVVAALREAAIQSAHREPSS